MDSNGLKFWSQNWSTLSDLEYEAENKVLRLASQRAAPTWTASLSDANALLERVPGSIDRFGTRAFLSSLGTVMGTGVASDSLPLFKPASGDAVTDITIGFDGLLYLALAGGVAIIDLLGRTDIVKATPPNELPFNAWRLAAIPSGGVWALDATNNKLARLNGSPLFVQPHPDYAPNTVRPCEENPNPSRLMLESKAVWPADERAVAIASSPDGRLALLTWTKFDFARLRILSSAGVFGEPVMLDGSKLPYSLTWVSQKLIALMLPGLREAFVYSPDATGNQTLPAGDVYPLKDPDGGPFLHGVSLPPNYPTVTGVAPLVKLSLPAYARKGSADGALLMDSGSPSTVWHRLYLESIIPDHCG